MRFSSIAYDGNGNPLQTTLPNAGVITNTYYANGLIRTMKDPENNTTTFNYNNFGDLTSIVAPAGTTTFTYDNMGRRTSITDANGHVTSFTYDNYNNILSITDDLSQVLSFEYDPNGNTTKTIDKKGEETTYVYDAKDRLTSRQLPLNITLSYAYDEMDNLTEYTDGEENVFSFSYNVRNELTSTTNSLGSTEYFYDANGNLTQFTNAEGESITNQYDPVNRRTSISDALGNTTTYTFDDNNRVTELNDADNNKYFYTYNGIGKLTSVTDPISHIAAYEYDKNGNLTKLTDPNSNDHFFTYDGSNRLITKLISGGYEYNYTYDGVGNVRTVLDPNGTTATMSYDELNRLTNINYSTGEVYDYVYDANNNITTASNVDGNYSIVYDAINRITQVIDPFNDVIGYTYDKASNKTSISYPSNGSNKTVEYTYNGVNQMTSVTDWLNNTTTYQYDAVGRLIRSTLPNGIKSEMGYDAAGRLISKYNKYADNSILSKQVFTLDALGNIVNEDHQYPAQPTLVEEVDKTYAYGSDDRIINAGAIAFSHDNNGNRTSMNGEGHNYTYTYGGDNLLKNWTADTLNMQFKYDAFKIRNEKSVNGNTDRFTLDINSGLTQFLQEKDNAGQAKNDYIYGLGLIGGVDENDEVTYYSFDHRGNTIATLDASASILESYLYSPFGKVISESPTNQPFTFLGMYGIQQDVANNYYIRARYYDGNLGAFTSKDVWPMNFRETKSTNRYIYGTNDPINNIDVNGLWPKANKSYEPSAIWGLLGSIPRVIRDYYSGTSFFYNGSSSNEGSVALDLIASIPGVVDDYYTDGAYDLITTGISCSPFILVDYFFTYIDFLIAVENVTRGEYEDIFEFALIDGTVIAIEIVEEIPGLGCAVNITQLITGN
ncbi:MAG: RHS repeat-associated core domain-containing protein [Chitinophagales bacterium]